MDHYQKPIPQMIADLADSPYLTPIGDYAGLQIEAMATPDCLRLAHNLGGAKVPTKLEAIQKLTAMREFYLQLRQDPEFSRFAADRAVVFELYVFSGQMDFGVALMKGDQIEWLTELG